MKSGALLLEHLTRAALASALMLAGCGRDVADRPSSGGTAVLIAPGSPVTANPLLATDVYSQELTRSLLFVSLLGRDGELALVPRLAERWRLSGDTAAEFMLRRDVQWSDGRPVTAADVAFTYRLAQDTAGPYAGRAELAHLLEVVAVDSYTVRWRFQPVREALEAATLPVLPAHVLDTVPAAALGASGFNRAPVTSGAFRVVRAGPGSEWVLGRNPQFPGALGGPPLLDRLVWREVSETAAQAAELEAGEADVAIGLREEAAAALDAERFTVLQRPTLRYTTLAWNGRRPPLSDTRVRRALGLAIDRAAVIAVLRYGFGEPAATPVPPGHWAYAPEVAPLPHDTATARRLLSERGGAAVSFTLLYPAGSDFNRDLAQLLQAQLGAVGVQVVPEAVEFATLIGIITGADRDFDAVLLALDADPRIDLRSLFHTDGLAGPFQLAGFSHAPLDAVLDSLEWTLDREAARPLWARAQQLIAEQQPWAFLYHGTETVVVRSPVRGVEADLRGVLWSAPRWWRQAGPGDQAR